MVNLKFYGFSLFLCVVWATLIAGALFAAFQQQWNIFFLIILAVLLTLAPFFIQSRYQIHIPRGFTVFIIFFIYTTLFLGGAQNFYERFWWWDDLLHFLGAIGLGILAFAFLLTLYKGERVYARPFMISVFALLCAIAVGTLWEMLEFALDSLFGWNMQRSGLPDTMGDLIINTIGAAIAAVSGYFYMKQNKKNIISSVIHELVVGNSSKNIQQKTNND